MASFIPELSTGSLGVYSEENKENHSVEQEKVNKVAQKVDLKEPVARKPLATRVKAESQNKVSGSVSEQDLGKAIVECINLGHAEKAESLLKQLGGLPSSFVDDGVNKAAYLGHLGSVELLLAYGELSEKGRGQAIVKAIKIGKIEIVQCLLKNGSIDEIYRERAIKEAKKNDQKEIIEILEKI